MIGTLAIYSTICVLGLAIMAFLMAVCGLASESELEDRSEQNPKPQS